MHLDKIQQIANDGYPLCITATKAVNISQDDRAAGLKAADIIRNQIKEGRGYLHGIGGRTMDSAIKWATKGGGRVYSVTRKGIQWITNIHQVAEGIKRARQVSWNQKGEAVKAGTREYLKGKGMTGETQLGISHSVDQPEVKAERGEYWDDVTGIPLRPELVRKARQEEMREFANHGVYVKVSEEECWRVTGKGPIGTRWVDINKGDDDRPEY